jgi:hypothetical protein
MIIKYTVIDEEYEMKDYFQEVSKTLSKSKTASGVWNSDDRTGLTTRVEIRRGNQYQTEIHFIRFDYDLNRSEKIVSGARKEVSKLLSKIGLHLI